MANNPSLNAKVVTSITKSSSGKTTYNTTGGNAKTSTPKLPSYSGNRSGGNSYSGSGAYRMSADQYDRYEQDYTTWKQTGQHTSGYSSWGNQRDLDTWKSIRDGKVKSARVGNNIYYMDNDSYKRYTKDYDSWSRTGSHSADYGKWANNDGTAAFRYIRDDANGYGGLNNLKASLDDELTKAVAEKYRSQWGDKYYYDVTNPDDIAAMNAGQMPAYLRKKYRSSDPIDQWLMEQGLPYGTLFNDMYSEAWQDRNERNTKRQQTYESAFNDMAAYQRGMSDLKKAMIDGMSFEDALATGRFDALGDFYDSSFGKKKESDTAGDQYYKAKKTQLDPVYDRAYEAMRKGETPDDEFFDQYKESTWKSYLKQKQKWNESSLQDVFDYQAIQNAGALIQESIDENKLVPVSKQAMKDAGYRATDEWTMFSPQVFTNKDGTQSIVLNPIREDGTVIPKADLEKIAKRRLGEAGIFGGAAGKDDQSAFIAEFDTKKEARDYANSLSDAVTTYYRTDQEDFGTRLEEARNRGKSEQQAQLDAAVAAGDVNAVQELVPDTTQEQAEQLIADERVKAKLEEAEPFKARLDEIDEKLSRIQDGYMGRRGPSPSKRAEWDALLKEKDEVYAQYRELIDTATGIANTTKQDAVIDAEIKSNETTGSYVERPDFIENTDSFDRNAVTGSDESVASVNEILNNYADGNFDKIMRGEDVSEFASSHVNANDQGMWRTSVFNEYYSARYMTDDEARTFEYIAKTEGADAAVKYMDDLLPVLNWRNSEEVNVKMAQEAGRNPVISWLAAGISQFVDMFEGYAGFWNSLGEISGDPDARGAMANDPRFNVTRKYDMVDAALAQETDRRFGSKALNYVQNMATNLRDNVMRQAAGIALEALFPGVGKVFSTAAVTGSVLGQSLMENMDKGVDLQKATLLSFLNAGAEALGEAISMDALLGFKEGATDFVAKQAAKGIAASPGQIIRNYIFGTGLKEGGSEFMTSLMSMAAEALTLGDDSDVMQFYNEAVENGSQHPFGDTVLHVLGQAGSEGIAGALTGYILGGPTSINNTIQIGRASGAETNQFRAGLDTLNLLGQEEVDFHKALESKIEVAVAESGTNIQSITRLQIQQDIKDSTVLGEEEKNVLSNVFELVGSAPGETLDAETQANLFNCVKALHQSVLDQNAKDAKTEKKASKADQRLHDYFAAVAQYQLEAKMALESGNLQAHAAAMNNLTGAVERYKYALTERDQDQTVDEAQQAADQEREKTKLEKAMEPLNEAAGQVTAWYQGKAVESRAEQQIANAAAENAAPQQEEPLDWQVFNLYEKLTDASENGDQETIDEAGAEFERLSTQYGEEFNKLWQQAIEGTLNPQPVRTEGSEAQFYADLVNDQSEEMMRARAEARDTSIDYSSIDNAARSIADRLLSDEERIKALRKSKVSLRRVRADLEADIKAFAKLFGVSKMKANAIPTAVMRELDGIVNDIKTGEIRGTIDEIVRERLKKTILDNYIVYAPTLSSIYNEEEVAEIKDWIKGKRFRYLFEDGKKSIVSYEIRNEARKQGLYFTKKGKDSLDQAYHDIQDIWKDGGIVSGEAMSPEDQAAEILEFLQGNSATKKPKTLGEFIKDPHNGIDPRGVDDELNKMMNGLLKAISPYLDERERIGVEKYGRNTEAERVYGGAEQVNPGEAEQQFYDTAIGAEPAAAPDVYVDQAGRVNGDQAESLYRSGLGERTDGNGSGPVSIEGESPAAAWSEGLDQRAFFDTIAKDYNTKHGLRGSNALKAEDFEAVSAPSTEESAKALRGAVQRNGGAPVLLYRCTKPNAPGGFVHDGQIYINEKGTAITSFEYGHEIAHLKKRIQDAGRRVFKELGQEGKQAFLNYCEKFRENPNDAQVMNEFICDIHGAYEYLIQRGVRLHDQLGLSAEQANAFYDAFSQANAQDSEFDTDDISEAVDAVATNGNTDYNYHSMDEDRALYRQDLIDAGIAGEGKVMSTDELNSLFDTIDAVMNIVGQNRKILDFFGDKEANERVYSPYKQNSDPHYKMALDFSTLCRKRVLLQTIAERLQEKLGRSISPEETVALRNEILKYQKEGRKVDVACALCYVEAARLKSPKVINQFLDDRGYAVKYFLAMKDKEFASEVNNRKAQFKVEHGYAADAAKKDMSKADVKELERLTKKWREEYQPDEAGQAIVDRAASMDRERFLSAKSLAQMKEEDPEIYDAFITKVRSATRSKAQETEVPYFRGDVESISDTLIEQMNEESGFRHQSWSDFEITHLLDNIAAVIELSTRHAKMHAYTKVPAMVIVNGRTGMMMNMSLIPSGQTGIVGENVELMKTLIAEYADAIENNKDASEIVQQISELLTMDPNEGMPREQMEALRAKYHETAGNIMIGINDTQIRALLASDLIDYVIPYHTSGLNKGMRDRMGIKKWNDYTKFQNEQKIGGGAAENAPHLNEWFNIEEARQDEDGVKYMQDASRRYLQLCAEHGLVPKFAQFLVNNGDGSYSLSNDALNYWKLLIDRKMVDQATGKVIEQQAVVPRFDERDENGKLALENLLEAELESGVREDQEFVADDIVSRFIAGDIAANSSKEAKRLSKELQDRAERYAVEYLADELRGTDFSSHQINDPDAVRQMDAEYMTAVENGDMETAQRLVDEAAEAAGIYKRNAGEETNIYIPNGTDSEGNDVSFTDLILDGEKLGETRGLNTHFPVGKWLGIAKDGEVVGRVMFGNPIEITKDSPEYQSAYIEGTNYDIPDGQTKLYYPIVNTMDFRDAPRQIVRNGNYGAYQLKSNDPVVYDDYGNVIPLSERFNSESPDFRYSDHNVTEPTEESDFYSDAVNTARQAQDLYQAGTSVAEYMANAVYDPDVANQLSGIEQRNLKAPTGLTQDQRRQMYEWDRERLRALKTEDRARLIEQRQKMLARQSRAKSRENITRNANELRNWMNSPSVKDGKYVPDFLKESVLNALKGIDLGSTKREGGMVVQNWRKSMQDLANVLTQYHLHELSEDSDPRFEGAHLALPDWFAAQFSDLAASIPENGTNYLQDMDADQLEALDKSLGILKASIKKANEAIGMDRKQTIAEVSEESISEMNRRKSKRESDNKFVKGVDTLFNADILDPNSYAKRLGNAGGAMVQGIIDGFVNGTTKVHEAADFVEQMEKDIGVTKRDTHKWSNTPLTVTLESGETISMTEAQAMNLYALSHRTQALQHILNGGIELGYNRHTRNNQNRAYKLSFADMDNVFSKLSDKQKTYVDRLQTYLSTTASKWGNEVSQKLYETDLYGEDFYWPIKSAKSNLATQDPEKVRAMNAIINSGFTNALNKYAKNPIMLDDATQVFTDHIAQMSNYNGLSIPIANAMKWFNYQRRGIDGSVDYNKSVKRSIVNALGRNGTSYFINLIKDVNGLSEGGTGTALPSAIVSNAKRAAVAAKLRVMVQQPTAIVRAMGMINPKYFVGISNAKLPSVVKEMQDAAPIAWWKSQGNFDIGTGKSMRDILFGDGNAYDQTMNAMMAPAGWADDFGWAVIWNAVKREQQARNKGLSEKDLMAKVVRRFTDVINETQVIDTVVHRSQIMRSKDDMVKQSTAFMSEPMKTLNMLRNAVYDVQMGEPGAKGRLAKSAAAVAGSWALNAAVLALHDSLRDRDEDDDFWEMVKEKWLKEFMDNANPINSIPYVKDVAALIKGDDVDRMDMSGLGDLITSIQRISKAIQEGDSNYTAYGLTRGLLTSIGNVLGTPVNGLISTAETITNGIKPGLIQKKKSKGWQKAETLVEEGIDKNAARGLMKNFNSDNTATKAFSILAYDGNKDGIPDFDEDEQNIIAEALGLSYNPEKDGSLTDYAVKAAGNYLKGKQKIMDNENSTDEEYAKAEEAYDKYSQLYDDWFEFLGL